MSPEEITEFVDVFRKTICDISEEEVEDVLKLCRRKMAITGKKEDYLKLLLPDELKNHVLRRTTNATTMLRKLEKEE